MSETSIGGPKLFGMIALSLGMVTRGQLDECLAIQRESAVRHRLGAIILSRGYMNNDQVREVLHVQARVRKRAVRPISKSGRRKLLGQILIEHGRVSKETLTAILRRQEKLRNEGFSLRIGELLVANGEITPIDLKEALTAQSTA